MRNQLNPGSPDGQDKVEGGEINMAEFETETDQTVTIPVTFDGRTKNVQVGYNERVEDIARLYRLDVRQYAFYDQDDGMLDLGDLIRDLSGVRIIQNPKGAC